MGARRREHSGRGLVRKMMRLGRPCRNRDLHFRGFFKAAEVQVAVATRPAEPHHLSNQAAARVLAPPGSHWGKGFATHVERIGEMKAMTQSLMSNRATPCRLARWIGLAGI